VKRGKEGKEGGEEEMDAQVSVYFLAIFQHTGRGRKVKKKGGLQRKGKKKRLLL